jgi:Tol biopolymer transport system component
MPRIYLLVLLACALLAPACAIEINSPVQITPTPVPEVTPASLLPSSLPSTHVPVTWGDLGLRGSLVYPGSTGEADSITGTVQMLDLETGEIFTLWSAPGAWIYYASVSPDGKWLVMSYSPAEPANAPSIRILYILPLDGSSPPEPLFMPSTAEDRYTQAEWSPDGKYIYYVHYNHEAAGGQFYEVYEIFRISYPHGTAEKIVDRAFWPRLSADSTRLAYVSLDAESGKNELWLAEADGSNPHKIALSGSLTQDIVDAPIFSPDGQSLLFSVPSAGQAYQPSWLDQLTGVRIARAHNVPSDWWSVPLSGGIPIRLTHIQSANLFASLSPDGRHIASLSGEGIFIMDPDGSGLTRVLADTGAHGTVSWIP